VTCVVTHDSTISEALEALGDEAYDLPIAQVKCLPVGRAVKKVRSDSLLSPSAWEMGRECRSDFDTLSIVHDGTVYPCCAVGGFTDGIALGQYPENSMHTLLRKRDNDFRWIALSSKGPHFLMNYATSEELKQVGADKTLHDCVNCHRLFSSPL